jgi:hypothetical protein
MNKLILSIIAIVILAIVQVANAEDPKANIINTKRLTIKDPKYHKDMIGYSITGTVTNISVKNMLVSVYALIYDANNNVVDVGSGTADLFNLKSGDSSAFKISFLSDDDIPDHYTLVAGGQ